MQSRFHQADETEPLGGFIHELDASQFVLGLQLHDRPRIEPAGASQDFNFVAYIESIHIDNSIN